MILTVGSPAKGQGPDMTRLDDNDGDDEEKEDSIGYNVFYRKKESKGRQSKMKWVSWSTAQWPTIAH